MGDEGFMRKSLLMLAGLLVWAAHFMFVYAFVALICARRLAALDVFGISVAQFVVLAATVAAATATLALLLLAGRRSGPAWRAQTPANDFMRYTAMTVAALSTIAILWNGLPALMIAPCG